MSALSRGALAVVVGGLAGWLAHGPAASASALTNEGALAATVVSARAFVPPGATSPTVLLERLAKLPRRGAREAQIIATAHEPADAADLRHEIQLADLQKQGVSLKSATLDHYLRVTDFSAQQNRIDRARFLLGEISEPEYIDARMASLRAAFKEYQRQMTPEEFMRVFHWRPDKDPFDPAGAIHEATMPPPSPPPMASKDPAVAPTFAK